MSQEQPCTLMKFTSIAWPSAVLGTTMKRRDRGGMLSGSGAGSGSQADRVGTPRLQGCEGSVSTRKAHAASF